MAVKTVNPNIPVTTNFMGAFPGINYHELAKEVDIVSWDSYPGWGEDNDVNTAIETAFYHDLMRGLKNGKPFMLMESTPSNVNWKKNCRSKRPGQHILSSLQAIAHGSDSVQYFQLRKSRGSSEKMHGAVIDHVGHENTRVFREVAELGYILNKLDSISGSVVKSDVAIIYSWESRWAITECQGYKKCKDGAKGYVEAINSHYRYFVEHGISVDVVGVDAELSQYQLVIMPMLYSISECNAKKLSLFVENGGCLVATYMSAVVNENDLVYLGGLPGGNLMDVFGIWSEEVDILLDHQENTVEFLGKQFVAKDYCEVIHLKDGSALANFQTDFYANSPAVTRNNFGSGVAYYMGFCGNNDFLKEFYNSIICELGIQARESLPAGVHVARRKKGDTEFIFIQNFNNELVRLNSMEDYYDIVTGKQVKGSIELQAYETIVATPPPK